MDVELNDLLSMSENKTEKRGRPVHSETDNIPTLKKRTKNDLMPIEVLNAYLCCMFVCLASIPSEVLNSARTEFQKLNMTARATWVLQWLQTHTRPDNKTVYIIGGKEVCQKAWLMCLGLPTSTFYSIWSKFLGNVNLDFCSAIFKSKIIDGSQ
ncbi:uncharacterized protein LOC128215416 [Mya arenaria]|uniref:uncharacterized protein LOC128215416 n=1 Tax=Mya arenaria TaxID=6604 RepID=UPI0022E36F6D|nr:uncharacterized protein LOC128215416 [Mya arenaria]